MAWDGSRASRQTAGDCESNTVTGRSAGLFGANHQLAKESILLLEPAEFTWENTVRRFETAAEVGHVRKAPAGCDLGHGSMGLERVLQGPVAAVQPSGLDEAGNRCPLLSKERVRVPHAHAGRGGNHLGIEPGIGETRLYGGTHIHQGRRLGRRKIRPWPL